jgi:hypothetical protein
MLQLAIVPLREPERVELRARFDAGVTPKDVQEALEGAITVPIRNSPDIALEELDRDEVVVKISATPSRPDDGAQLAAEVMSAVQDNVGSNGDARKAA